MTSKARDKVRSQDDVLKNMDDIVDRYLKRFESEDYRQKNLPAWMSKGIK
jgi:hypothetical protein